MILKEDINIFKKLLIFDNYKDYIGERDFFHLVSKKLFNNYSVSRLNNYIPGCPLKKVDGLPSIQKKMDDLSSIQKKWTSCRPFKKNGRVVVHSKYICQSCRVGKRAPIFSLMNRSLSPDCPPSIVVFNQIGKCYILRTAIFVAK